MTIDQCFMYPGARERLREMFEEQKRVRNEQRIENELRRVLRKEMIHFEFDHPQLLGRLQQERALRAGTVRHPPSIFGGLA